MTRMRSHKLLFINLFSCTCLFRSFKLARLVNDQFDTIVIVKLGKCMLKGVRVLFCDCSSHQSMV